MQPSVTLCVSPAHRPLIPSFIALTTRSLPRSTRLNISGSHYPTSLAGLPILAILSVRPTPPWVSSDATYAAVLRSSKRQPTSVWWDQSWSTQPPFGTPTCLKTSTPYQNSRWKLPGLWKDDYGRFNSVTSMLHDLGWKDLKDRRRDLRLVLLYKITHRHVAVPAETLKLRKPTSTVSVRSGVFRHNWDSVGTRRLYRHNKTSLLA